MGFANVYLSIIVGISDLAIFDLDFIGVTLKLFQVWAQ